MESWKYDHLIKQLHRTAYKRHENFVVSALIHDRDLREFRIATQHYVRRGDSGYALVDIYYPQIDLAVEVDEPHHGGQLEQDLERERHVREELRCEVIRIHVASGSVPAQIQRLKESMLRRMGTRKRAGTWEAWKEPRRVEIDQLKAELKRTMFVKILGEIHPDDLMARQTGYWFLAASKRKRVEQVVVVHDGVVSRVFEEIRWRPGPAGGRDAKKWGFDGIDRDAHSLVGAIVNGWNYQ